MKTLLAKVAASGIALASLALAIPVAQAATPGFDTTGSYVFALNYLGTDYNHSVSLTQNNVGTLSGFGTSTPYAWTITSGSVSGNSISFDANYTATADAVTPLTTMHVTGTIANDGTMSGTWSDNYQGGSRSGTWHTTSGTASALGTLAAQDFGVVNYDTGLGFLKGYTAGFGVSDNTLAGATAVVVKLYGASDQLLQTNTAILSKFNADITGTQFSSPFDVSGTFNYATDGYWTNVRETQYGQSIPAVKVVATVTLANGKTVTATNTNLTGDPTTIYPVVVPTTYMLTYTAAVHGTLTGSTTQSVVSGANGTAVTAVPATGYHFVKWSDNSTANPRTDTNVTANLSVTAIFASDTTPPPPTGDKNQCKKGGWMDLLDKDGNHFKNQGQCVSTFAKQQHAEVSAEAQVHVSKEDSNQNDD